MITELHIKNATMRCPHIPENLRGTYLGLCHPFMIDFFKKSGIDKIQLMPVMEFDDEHHLQEKGLTNHWGYNPSDWMKPTVRYATAPWRAEEEFIEMVNTLHDNDILVIIDVVYNHVSEDVREGFVHWGRNYSGCGDTVHLEFAYDRVLESLGHWYNTYNVDGFRFDLAPILGRDKLGAFNPHSRLLRGIRNDPLLYGSILVAEPWDCETYQLGNFPSGWQECTDQYRQCVRHFWKGTAPIRDLAIHITGDQERFKDWQNKRPVNYVTYHDGFTLQDLVGFDMKNNYANMEGNQDGSNNNASWSRHIDGDTHEMTKARRERDKRSMMTTLLYSLGEPHILFGDLFSHTQHGNNNAYCQDNDISYMDWDFTDRDKKAFYEFMVSEIKQSKKVMKSFNDAVGGRLQYDWTCRDWSGQEAKLVLTVDDKTLTYDISREGINITVGEIGHELACA